MTWAIFVATVGVYVSLTSVVLVDLLGLEVLTSSFGLTLLFIGIAGVIGTPIAGIILVTVDGYRLAFCYCFNPLIRPVYDRFLLAIQI